ncbi:MAG: hypothetical protein A2Z38_12040 [Planctomycetes bacterium RBG_19FT_COMBO_48_8]|nr:MAG: hypothetical protein A2Z38_12040 [Planctomycetes bacterium RBG_19FT_COMBO_48_8]
MALSSDNIKTLRQFADKLEKWAENLSYSTSPAGNLWVELTLSIYPQDVHSMASWLANIPTNGQKTAKELEELSHLVQKVDAWRNQGVYIEDLGEFCARVNRLIKVTMNIISALRNISGPEESEPPEDKAATVENLEVLQTPQTNPASPAPDCASARPPSQEAMMAYKLHYDMGLTIQQVAKRMTTELKLDKALRQWQISRWIKQVENRDISTRIPIRSVAPRTSETPARSARKIPPHKPTLKKYSRPR